MNLTSLPQIKTRKTVFVCGEGMEDSAFLRYLHDLYHRRQFDPRVNIISGRGGTSDGVVYDASKKCGGYDYKYVVLDDDKGKEEKKAAQEAADRNGIVVIFHTPCLEWLLLTILEDDTFKPTYKGGRCKYTFEHKYFAGKSRTDWMDYKSVFPKSLLNRRMKLVPELKRLYYLVRGRVKKIII